MKFTNALFIVAALASLLAVLAKQTDHPSWRHLDRVALLKGDLSIFRMQKGDGDGVTFTPKDRDLVIRTLYGEAVHEPRLGQMAVAWVIRNRYEKNPYGWKTLSKVVSACGYVRRKKRRVKICQFEPWLTRKKAIFALEEGSDHYIQLGSVVDDVLHGRASDPTGGAWYFLNKKIVQKRRKKQGRNMPKWAQNCTDIGLHSFCKPDGDMSAKADSSGSLTVVWNYLKKLVVGEG